jgi:phosphoribosyl 1,2-cyclic phosphodiesterase
MRVKFWGVRGSIPCPGPDTVRYGGNTACVELYIEQIDRRIVIDAGSGIRALGNELIAAKDRKAGIKADIFITHTHWDHIMGFPFFGPLYLADSRFKIYGPVTHEAASLESVLGGQLTYRYFPVRHEELAASISYVDLKEGEYDLGQGVTLKTKYLNHPLLCMGYRFEFDHKVVCTAYDTEPFINLFGINPNDAKFDADMAAEGDLVAAEQNRHVEAFVRGADLVIYDAQYTQAEYAGARVGWGHSSIEHAVDVAYRNAVKQLALFHHDVQRHDEQLDALQSRYCQDKRGGRTEVLFAREGMCIDL